MALAAVTHLAALAAMAAHPVVAEAEAHLLAVARVAQALPAVALFTGKGLYEICNH